MVFVLRALIEKSIEWRLPIYVADGDLPKAYDNARHSLACRRLVDKGFPEIIVAATIRETRKNAMPNQNGKHRD